MKAKLKIIKKAYQVNLNKILYGYERGEVMCYAKSRSQAKSKLLQDLGEATLNNWDEEEVNFLNIPVIRYPEADKFEFEGEAKTLEQIEEIQQERERQGKLNNILKDQNISHCYIQKGSYYRPGWSGYTDFKIRAGVYKKEEAISHARNVRDISIIPVNIQEHNETLQKEIKELQSRIL